MSGKLFGAQTLPLIEEIHCSLSANMDLLDRFRGRPFSFLLDSGMDPRRLGRYSFLGCDPFLVLSSRGRNVRVDCGDRILDFDADPLDCLRDLLRRYHLTGRPGLPPFFGGAVGYLAYDLGRLLEVLPRWAEDDLGLPELYLGFYDAVVAIDHLQNRSFIISTGLPEVEPALSRRRALDRLEELKDLVTGPVSRLTELYSDGLQGDGPMRSAANRVSSVRGSLKSNFTPEEYCGAVTRAKEYIAAGDIYQVNLSQRFTADLTVPPVQLYRRLREINPAPFASYLDFGELQVVSASPERFLKLGGRQVETRPIKGTRPRGADPAADWLNREALWNSEKDRAELLMIIDLERNDLGRVCQIGSVKVPELYTLESYATVHHLVSTVTGVLPPDRDVVDLLKAAFPGGSITGAPKIRAMEIIEELEPVRRGIYTGSIGYIGFNGDADLNIVIRTLIAHRDRVYLQVGGGIVADSVPEQEYQETLDKGRALFDALMSAGQSPGRAEEEEKCCVT